MRAGTLPPVSAAVLRGDRKGPPGMESPRGNCARARPPVPPFLLERPEDIPMLQPLHVLPMFGFAAIGFLMIGVVLAVAV